MTTEIQTQINLQNIQNLILHGDLSGLGAKEKLEYYAKVCDSVGLNPLTKPFDYLKLNGKEVLYANKSCSEQLRKVHTISLSIVDRQKIDDVYVVTAEAQQPNGRKDSSTGAVSVANLKGEQLANAFMKAETKAKRRVTLSICGLGMLDETEVESVMSIQNNQVSTQPQQQKPVALPTGNAPVAHSHPEQDYQPNFEDDGMDQPKQNLGDYVVQVGKAMKGKKLSEIADDDLIGLINWAVKEEDKTGKPITGKLKETLHNIENYLNERGN